MEIFMRGCGLMGKQTELGFIGIRMGRNIRGNGGMIDRMEREERNGPMGLSTKAALKTE